MQLAPSDQETNSDRKFHTISMLHKPMKRSAGVFDTLRHVSDISEKLADAL